MAPQHHHHPVNPNGPDGDLDHDGIPNHEDRDMDGDGVPNGQDPDPKDPKVPGKPKPKPRPAPKPQPKPHPVPPPVPTPVPPPPPPVPPPVPPPILSADQPAEIDLSRYELVVADPSSFNRVVAGLRPGQRVLLNPGRYSFTSLHVPGTLFYAAAINDVIVDNRVELHELDTAILNLVCNGGIVLDADRTRASRSIAQDSGGVDCVSFQGRDQVLDFCSVLSFQSVGIGTVATAVRNPLVYGVHLHDQVAGGAPLTRAMMMIGHNHTDSAQPVNIRVVRTLVENSQAHDGPEVKSSGAYFRDVTVMGCDLMQRHGIVGLTAESCYVEGGDIQLNSNGPKAIHCQTVRGIVRVVAGTASVEELLDKSKDGPSLYPYANGAEVHSHLGEGQVGWARSGWNKAPIGTMVSDSLGVHAVNGASMTTVAPLDALPPAPRKLAPGEVGPLAV